LDNRKAGAPQATGISPFLSAESLSFLFLLVSLYHIYEIGVKKIFDPGISKKEPAGSDSCKLSYIFVFPYIRAVITEPLRK
jgi:hypothetical protein